MPSVRPVRPRGLGVVVTDQAGRPAREPGLRLWLTRIAPARARGRVVVALVPDRVMRRLNRAYRGRDEVTDVLAFPAGPGPQPAGPALGDLVIATGRAARQAREAGHAVRRELRILALHGLLHLLGYDHHGDGGRMARVERRLLRKGGLGRGLIGRAAGA